MSNIKMGIDVLGAANNIERCRRKNVVLYQFTSARTCNGCPAWVGGQCCRGLYLIGKEKAKQEIQKKQGSQE